MTEIVTVDEAAAQPGVAAWLKVRRMLPVPVIVKVWGGKHAGPVAPPAPLTVPDPAKKLKQIGPALVVVLELVARSGIGVVV